MQIFSVSHDFIEQFSWEYFFFSSKMKCQVERESQRERERKKQIAGVFSRRMTNMSDLGVRNGINGRFSTQLFDYMNEGVTDCLIATISEY